MLLSGIVFFVIGFNILDHMQHYVLRGARSLREASLREARVARVRSRIRRPVKEGKSLVIYLV